MSVRNVEAFFSPKSIALIGASRREHSVGAVIAKNLLDLPVDPTIACIALSLMPVAAAT